MFRNKDNYVAGNIIFLTLNILCLSNKQWIVCFLLSTSALALILALRWCLVWHARQGSLKIIFTATSGTILQAYCWPIESWLSNGASVHSLCFYGINPLCYIFSMNPSFFYPGLSKIRAFLFRFILPDDRTHKMQ